jgi:tetratricopeptide (TPR) repeat protein
MTSDEFDTLLILLGPDGEEVAFNDDAEGSLNSRIVYTVPTSGQYTIVARSYAGNGGNYSLQVGPATDYEIAFGAAQEALAIGDYGAAQTLFTEAISLNPDAAEAYLARVDAYFGEVYEQLEAEGRFFEGPSDLPDDIRAQIVDDFLVAAALYEGRGDIFIAESLREQAVYFRTGAYPESPDPEAMPEPEGTALPAEEAQ